MNVSAPLNGQASNESSPSIAVNPLNPNQVVSVWTRFDPSNNTPTPVLAFGRFSTNGGATFTTFAIGGVLTNPATDVNNPQPFAQTTDAQVAMDRNGRMCMC